VVVVRSDKIGMGQVDRPDGMTLSHRAAEVFNLSQ
jgi:hypothetical protein